MDTTWAILLEFAMGIGFKIGVSLLVYLAFHTAGIVIKRIMDRVASRIGNSRAYVIRLAARITRVTLIVVGAVTAIGTLGVNVSALVASLGLTGFALGFALKDALSNILAGILIMFYQTFRIGGRIKMAAFEGVVTKIDLRYTSLKADDGTAILIPNSKLFNEVVVIQNPDN